MHEVLHCIVGAKEQDARIRVAVSIYHDDIENEQGKMANAEELFAYPICGWVLEVQY